MYSSATVLATRAAISGSGESNEILTNFVLRIGATDSLDKNVETTARCSAFKSVVSPKATLSNSSENAAPSAFFAKSGSISTGCSG